MNKSENVQQDVPVRVPTLVQEHQLRELISSGAANKVVAVRNGEGFELKVEVGVASFVFGSTRGEVRTFSSLDTLAGMVKKVGGEEFIVNVSNLKPSGSKVG